MKAMVFAAGVGSRLRPLTDKIPKALIEVGGKTLLETVLRRLKAAGVRAAIVNVHHFPEQIEAFLKSRDLGLKVEVSREETLLDTGGGLKKAAWFFDDGMPFLVHNVDVLSDCDLRDMVLAHQSTKALVTLAVADRPSTRRLLFDRKGFLLGREAGPGGPAPAGGSLPLAFAGIQVVSAALLPLLIEDGAFSITDATLRLAAAGHAILTFRIDGAFWADAGTPKGLAAARARTPRGF